MNSHAAPRHNRRNDYTNYLRPRRLIKDALYSSSRTEADRRKSARRASAHILKIYKHKPPSPIIDVEDFILIESKIDSRHETLRKNSRRNSLFRKTISTPYHSKKGTQALYQPKETIALSKKIKAKKNVNKRLNAYKLAAALLVLIITSGLSSILVLPSAIKDNSQSYSMVYDEDMTVVGAPIDISMSSQVLSDQTTAKQPEKIPSKIIIPALNVNGDIVPTGLHANGKLGMPVSKKVVGWYKASAAPDFNSSVLLTAHKDSSSPFNNLINIKNGDLIEILNNEGRSFWYLVTSLEFYAAGEAPMQQIVTANKGEKLVIVVPNGHWTEETMDFSERFVVIAEPSKK